MKKAILALALVMSIGATQSVFGVFCSKTSLSSNYPTGRFKGCSCICRTDHLFRRIKTTRRWRLILIQPVQIRPTMMIMMRMIKSVHSRYSLDNYDDPFDFIGSVFGGGERWLLIIFCIIFGLLFVFAPLIIVFLVIRYLIRRHNDRMKLAEMAMEKGINVPESDRPIDKQSDEYLVKRGLRNAFLGAGLCAMFAWWDADFLAGIRALVFFYGMGQTVIGSASCHQGLVEEPSWRSGHGGIMVLRSAATFNKGGESRKEQQLLVNI